MFLVQVRICQTQAVAVLVVAAMVHMVAAVVAAGHAVVCALQPVQTVVVVAVRVAVLAAALVVVIVVVVVILDVLVVVKAVVRVAMVVLEHALVVMGVPVVLGAQAVMDVLVAEGALVAALEDVVADAIQDVPINAKIVVLQTAITLVLILVHHNVLAHVQDNQLISVLILLECWFILTRKYLCSVVLVYSCM